MTDPIDSKLIRLLHDAQRVILRGFLFAAFSSFFLNFATLISAVFMIQVYERVIPAKSYETLYALMFIGFAGVVVYGLLDFVRNWTFSVMAHNFASKLSLPVLSTGLRNSVDGDLSHGGHAIRDVTSLRQFISGSSMGAPIDAAWSVIFLVALFFLHYVYALVALGFIAAMLILNLITDRTTKSALEQANEAQYQHSQDVANSLRHAEIIEAMGMLPALVRQWRGSQVAMLDLSQTATVRSRIVLALSKSVQKSLQMVTVSTGAILVLAGHVSPGVLFAGMVLTSQAVQPFTNMIENWRNWQEASSAWKRIRDLLKDTVSDRQTIASPVGGGSLVVENLSYLPPGAERPILRSLAFEIKPGEVLGIAGPSGAGKSTLARCLTGIVKPTAGGVYLDGQSTYLWERSSFGKAVGYLPQNISLLDGTIRLTISRMQDADPRDVIKAAQQAGIHDLIGRLPFGYDTPVKEGLHLLSGGQLQRLALARALFGQPKLIILDEPNSNLDNAGEAALINAIRDARAWGAMVVLIAHRPSVMAIADKMLIIENGRVTQFGPRTDVIRVLDGEVAKQTHDVLVKRSSQLDRHAKNH